jgi:isochorismate synthase
MSTYRFIWRLPSQSQLYGFIAQENGLDAFAFAPFVLQTSQLKNYFHKGTITPIDEKGFDAFFDELQLPLNHESITAPKNQYLQSVKEAKTAIEQQRFDKVVLARNKWIEGRVDYKAMFANMLQKYPNAFVFACVTEDGLLMLGATPETLLNYNGTTLFTEALGGTLFNNTYGDKELKEHQQIRDYIEQQILSLELLTTIGAIKTKQAGNVSHLCSVFSISVNDANKVNQLLERLHPTPAVCGFPKGSAMQFIIENEAFNRGYYAGFLGPVSHDNHQHLFVNLRSGMGYQNGLMLMAGAGINEMSIEEDEWLETERKMDTLLNCVHLIKN